MSSKRHTDSLHGRRIRWRDGRINKIILPLRGRAFGFSNAAATSDEFRAELGWKSGRVGISLIPRGLGWSLGRVAISIIPVGLGWSRGHVGISLIPLGLGWSLCEWRIPQRGCVFGECTALHNSGEALCEIVHLGVATGNSLFRRQHAAGNWK